MSDRVKLVNKTKCTVVINDPNIPFRREWTKKGQVLTIPMDIMQDLIYQEGVSAMLNDGTLEVVEKEDRIALGLETEGEEPTVKFLTENQMLGALVSKDIADLEKTLKKMPRAQIDEFIDLAVEKEITDMPKVDLIEKLTGRNIIKLVQFNRQLKEEPKEEN